MRLSDLQPRTVTLLGEKPQRGKDKFERKSRFSFLRLNSAMKPVLSVAPKTKKK